MPFGRNHYVTALKKRVSELEGFVAERGLQDQVSPFKPYDLDGPSSVSGNTASRPTSSAVPPGSPEVARPCPLNDIDALGSDSENGDSMVRILRDLSLESNGGYIGATSHFTIGRLVSSIIEGKHPHSSWEQERQDQGVPTSEGDEYAAIRLSDVSPDVASRLFHGYMKHVATRYPVLQSTWIYDLHCRRDRIHDPYERSTLHLVYAIAGRFLQTTGETSSSFFPDRHQAQVLQDLDEMLRYHDTRSVVTLLLLAIYSLRAEGGPGAWTYIGLAMRIAIDLGLHRQTTAMNRLGFDVEMRKRLFWSCYTMDRQISIPLGRPFSVADHDIDIELPLDVDEACQDIRALQLAAMLDANMPRTESTTLTAFLHILRIRRIESSIQQTIYRVDRPVSVTDAAVDCYLEQLEHWRLMIPLDAKRQVDRETAATVFMAGLTLVYCAWLSPKEIFNSTVSNDINACCIVLYVITERWPAARKYRDAFEAVKQTVIDPMSESQNHEPRRTIVTLPAVELPLDDGRREYDSIVSHMSGGQSLGMALSREPMAIGMEQVQYQMGKSSVHADGCLDAASLQVGAHSSEATAGNSNASGLSDGDLSGHVATWATEGLDNDMSFLAGLEPFDLEGCSVDMGWMADSFGSTAE
ncbi:hypothetical protein LTR85_005712 [Meristemomyces frigidus]|nr:hypothetical protein LTR85_005712 [Meristemomyces frigidus]